MAPQAPKDLPAGDARREAMARSADDLAQQAEERAAKDDRIAADPAKLKPIREIRVAFNDHGDIEIPNASPEYAYKFVNADIRRTYGNRFFMQAVAQGWEAVNATDDDAAGLEFFRSPDNKIIIGDVVLVRCRIDRYLQIVAQESERNRMREQGLSAGLRELGDKHARTGAIVHTNLTPDHPALKHAAARSAALGHLGEQIRQGTVPGMPAVGR